MPSSLHTLIVGGTGMLRAATLHLARHAAAVSLIARSHARLASLAQEATNIHPLPADWHDDQALALALRAAIAARGPVDLAVCWVHSDAPRAMPIILDAIASDREPPRVFHVVGSAGPDLSRSDTGGLARTQGIRYHRVILGFVVEGATSRWLTTEDISHGVIEAVSHDRTESVIGVVKPWQRRPG